MTFGPNSTNPRERRAYANALRAQVNANPTVAAITAVIESDAQLMRGGKKARAMGTSAVSSQVAGKYSFWIDTGVYYDPNDLNFAMWLTSKKGGDLLSGYVVPNDVAARLQAESHPTGRVKYEERHQEQHRLYKRSALYPQVMCGIKTEDRIKDARLQIGNAIPLEEAIANPDLGDQGWYTLTKEPYDILTQTDHLTLRAALTELVSREVAIDQTV